MFCVECGQEGETYDGLCSKCFLAKGRFVSLPAILDLNLCGECFAVRIGNKWVDSLSLEGAVRLALGNALRKDRQVAETSLKFDLTECDPRNYTAEVVVDFRVRDLLASERFSVVIRLKKETCKRCGRRAGHYYESIIQIRGPRPKSGRDILESARALALSRISEMGAKNRNIFISKFEEQHGGYDIYLSSSSAGKSIAKELAKEFGALTKSSASVAGMKDGASLKRMTYLVRLPEYAVGDILVIGGDPHLLRSVSEKQLVLFDLVHWHDTSISPGRLPDFELLRADEHVKDALVVSENETELQLMDPETMDTVDVMRPAGYSHQGNTVRVVKTNIGLLLLP